MDESDRFPFTPAVRNWTQSFAGEPLQVEDVIWIPTDDVRLGLRPAEQPGEWEVVRSERGSAPRRLMRGPAEHAERFLVWSLAILAQWALQRRSDSYPLTPRLPAPDASVAVEDGGDEVRITEDGRVIARFNGESSGRGDAIAFTYYRRLPAELLIEQIMGQDEAMAFPTRSSVPFPGDDADLARQVEDATRAALARWSRPAHERRERELRALQQSPALPMIRLVQQRLRYCSFVGPRPKEGEGDSLQVAFRVDDAAATKRLLAVLLLAPRQYDQTQRLRFGDESIEVTVTTGTAWQAGDAASRTVRLVVLRLWNTEHLYDVTPELVDRVARLELHLDELGLADAPRDTDLLGFITPERYPELFADP